MKYALFISLISLLSLGCQKPSQTTVSTKETTAMTNKSAHESKVQQPLKSLPEPKSPKTKFLFTVYFKFLPEFMEIGKKSIVNIEGGTVEGPAINGVLLRSGGDWLTHRADGSMALDVRATIKTDDNALIYCSYFGRLVMPPEMLEMPIEDRHQVDPTKYYMRTAPLFETASKRYAWLNNIQGVGIGRITPTGVAYDMFELL